MKRFLEIAVIAAVSVAGLALAEDVPQFRGVGGTGVSAEKDLPLTWSDTDNIRWKAALVGKGLSAPVIAKGRVYVTASSNYEEKRLHVMCFDVKDGKKLWERQLTATGTTLCHPKTNMAAPTPMTDGERVYAMFATCDLACLDRDGNLLWYRSLVGDYPTIGNNVGMAASPALAKDSVIVFLENAGESFVAAIDKLTGENRWRTPKHRAINWASPIVIDNGGQEEVVCPSSSELTAHDVATGRKKWTVAGGFSTIPSPTFGDGVVYAPGGKLQAIRVPNADIKEPKVLWSSNKLSSGYSSPTYYQGRVYALATRGVLNCADAATGKALWDQRVDGEYAASPLIADGKIYVVNEAGTTTVLEAGPQAKILATNSLKDKFLACPIASDGAIFLRSDKYLYCVGKKK